MDTRPGLTSGIPPRVATHLHVSVINWKLARPSQPIIGQQLLHLGPLFMLYPCCFIELPTKAHGYNFIICTVGYIKILLINFVFLMYFEMLRYTKVAFCVRYSVHNYLSIMKLSFYLYPFYRPDWYLRIFCVFNR